MKKALVTGSGGFVGRHMSKLLSSKGWHVGSGWELPHFDCNDMYRVMPANYDLVVHLAYHVGGRAAIERNRGNLARNLRLDAGLFEWADRPGHRPRIVYVSSSAAYPAGIQGPGASPLAEHLFDPAGVPDSDYGYAKLCGERLARNYAAGGGVVYVVRPFGGYGPGQSIDYPFPAFVDRAEKRLVPFPVWGDPTAVRDWIHVSDFVAGILAVVGADCRSPVNICTGVGTSFADLAKLCMREAGYEAPVEAVPNSPCGVHTRVGDPALFHGIYKPKVTLEQGVREAFGGSL